MSFDRFLFVVESRDLSQADKGIIRVSSFPKQNFFFCLSTTEAWTFCKINALNLLIFTAHQKNWVFLNDKNDQNIDFAKLPNNYVGIIYGSATDHTALRKKALLCYSCQLEIDHLTPQPKETCQMACRGPQVVCTANVFIVHYIYLFVQWINL